MREIMQKVLIARENLEALKDKKAALLLALEQQNAVLFNDIADAEDKLATLEEQARQERLACWDGSDKSKMFGAGIQEVTELIYTEDSAFDWAKNSGMCLKFDRSAFEKLVKSGVPLDVDVVVRKVPRATLAGDLGEYFGS